MGSDVDLKKIQRNVYMYFFQDGLWDIFLGLYLLGWGLAILTENPSTPLAVFLCGYLAVWVIKKRLTYPRIGYTRLGSTSRRRVKTGFFVLVAAVLLLRILVAALWEMDTLPQWLADYFPLLLGGILAGAVCLVSYWSRVNRFYIHAALIFLAGVLHQWLGIEWGFGFIGSGTIIVLVGLRLLIVSLRMYPKTYERVDGNVN